MRLQTLHHPPVLQIPNPQRPIHPAAHHGTQIRATHSENVHGIDVARRQLPDEWIGEHAIQLGSRDGAGVFAGAGEGMRGGIEVAVGLTEVVDGGSLGGGPGAAEGFDFHGGYRSIEVLEGNTETRSAPLFGDGSGEGIPSRRLPCTMPF
mmetsp:Transcript_15204/g.31897  ORF Transcript_15204/g.31897 Transcript_15204/m.31897 type:complete len:150 (+) Transcript_15204:1397-1846(+)